jgi:pimeloyl-ACP methyl ester carboxylesterase
VPTLRRDGVELSYSQSGEGPALLFHTGGGGDGRMWEMAGYTDVLGGARQILLDHRGHGRSGCPEGVEDHRIDEYVSDVIAVLDSVDAERAILVGYSAGAFVAYHTAAAHPDRCSAVVGIGGVALPNETYESSLSRIDRVRQVGMRATMQHMAASEDEPCPSWLLENLSSTNSEMFALLLEAWLDARSEWELFPMITAPTLIICGEHEDVQGETALAASTVQDGKAVLLREFGHLQAFWHGEITAPLIRDFLVSKGLLAPGVS